MTLVYLYIVGHLLTYFAFHHICCDLDQIMEGQRKKKSKKMHLKKFA